MADLYGTAGNRIEKKKKKKKKKDEEIRGTKNERRNDSFVHTRRLCVDVSSIALLKMRKIAPHQVVPAGSVFPIPQIIQLV